MATSTRTNALDEVIHHHEIGFNETDNRITGRGRIGSISFNEADELFRSWIDEKSWPYDALVPDPRVFTFIFEKTSRLISAKPKAVLIPREGSDVVTAKVNNVLLDYQWDMATIGGSMISKYSIMDMNARKYGAAFGLCKWRYELDHKGRVVFDGPEMSVINNRDFAHDLTATSIEGANWVQVRQYVTLQDLKRVNDASRGKPVYKNLDKLEAAVAGATPSMSGGDKRSGNWTSRNREISHIETDPYGQDHVFKNIEIVTEYRRDRWITFSPQHKVILRDIDNPYDNHEIPVTMLRYYAIDDDLYGLSEIEPVKGLAKAINALLCQYLDEINQNLYSPIVVGPGVKMHTIEWGKGARWMANNPSTDVRVIEGKSNAAQYFNNTYSALVAAMMNALGESSLGVSNMQPFQGDKTATEVKALQIQRNARDNYNQIFLAESIKRQLMLWHSMNQKMLFNDPERKNFVIRIVGRDAIDYFQRANMDGMDISREAMAAMVHFGKDNIEQFQTPKFPVDMGNGQIGTKLQVDDAGRSAMLFVEPEDLNGMYDFSVDVQSMRASAEDDMREGRATAVNLMVSNANVHDLLAKEGYKPKFRELFTQWLEDLGFRDADRYFEQLQGPDPAQQPPVDPNMLAAMMGGGAPGGMPMPGAPLPEQRVMQPQTAALRAQETGQVPPSPLEQVLPANLRGLPPTQQALGQPNEQELARILQGGLNG